MPRYTLIQEPDTIIADLDRYDRIGVDTEFMREKTFFAELCLVQISTGDNIYCIDPLLEKDMQDFWRNMMRRTWIVHSARQDIEVTYQSAQRMPAGLFDTQVAAGLLGLAPQLGYASLSKELFGVEIAKSHTRADWSKRPLSDALLRYAAEDVQYLLPAYDTLAELLDKKGRLNWAREDSALLLKSNLYDIDPQSAIERLKGARTLRGRHRAAAARLAAWRESEASRADRPRQWIAKDSVLVELASRLPESVDKLADIDGLPSGIVRRSGENLLEAIAASRNDDNDYAPPPSPSEAQKALLKKMQAEVAKCAGELGMAVEIVAAKRDLSALINGEEANSRVLNGWRRELIGNRLIELAKNSVDRL